MPSRTPKRDVSLTWPRCQRPGCGVRHVPEVECPPLGVWLVEAGPAPQRRASMTLLRAGLKPEIPRRSGLDGPGVGDQDDVRLNNVPIVSGVPFRPHLGDDRLHIAPTAESGSNRGPRDGGAQRPRAVRPVPQKPNHAYGVSGPRYSRQAQRAPCRTGAPGRPLTSASPYPLGAYRPRPGTCPRPRKSGVSHWAAAEVRPGRGRAGDTPRPGTRVMARPVALQTCVLPTVENRTPPVRLASLEPDRGGCTMPQRSHREVHKMTRQHAFRAKKNDANHCAYCGVRWNIHPIRQYTLLDQLKDAAGDAVERERWILAATLARAIEELSLDEMVDAGAAGALEALRGQTVAVPLIGKTRDEPDPAQSATRVSCATCGVAGTLFERLVDVSTVSDPDATMPGPSRWVHLDFYGYEREAADGHPFKLPEQP